MLRILDIGANRDEDRTDSPVIYENHQRAAVLAQRFQLDDLFVFCFSRDPYDRCVSWYEFHRHLEPYRSLAFRDWVGHGMPHHWEVQNGTDYTSLGISPLLQYHFVEGCRVDFVGKVESFLDDLAVVVERLNRMCERRGIDRRFEVRDEHLNRSGRSRDLGDYYDEDSKDLVYRTLEKDFLHFGYER